MGKNISNERILDVIFYDKNFLKAYLKDYLIRFLKGKKDNIDILLNAILELNNKSEIYPNDLIEFGNIINKTEGFRNFNFKASDNHNFKPVSHEMVFQKIYSLMDCYRNLWCEIDPIGREAYLNIHLMQIYPYPENNELICLLILMTNLIKAYQAPFIIENRDWRFYLDIVNFGDALKFKAFISKKSLEEFKYIIDFYKDFYKFPKYADIKEIIMQKASA